MLSVAGYYELTEKESESMLNGIREFFEFGETESTILHPKATPLHRRHIDVVVGKKENETVFVSVGCSSLRIKKRPYTEVFAKSSASPANEVVLLCNNLIKDACYNNEEIPAEYECALLNGYEFLFIDQYHQYHNMTGYWGVFVVPAFEGNVDGMGSVEFYQIIPAYKEELVFVEKNMNKVDYKALCKAIVEHIPERQYFDIKYDMLSQDRLKIILDGLSSK